MTASSMGWTPLFLNAVPHMTGLISPARVSLRMAPLISATVSSSPSRYFSISVVVGLGDALDEAWRYSSALPAGRPGSPRRS